MNTPTPSSKRYLRIPHLIAGLVILGVLARIAAYAVGAPIWGDEAFVATNFSLRDFAGMVKPLVYGQIVPLAFMWATLCVTELMGLSEWALRLVPFLSGLAAVGLFVRFARQTLPRGAALLAIGFFVSSYYIIRHTAEVKPYATDCLVSLILIMLTYRVQRSPERIGRWLTLIAACMAAPWCAYPSLFIVGASIMVLFFESFTKNSEAYRLYSGSRFIAPDQSRARKEAVPGIGAPKNRFLTGAALFSLLFLTTAASAAAMYVLIAKPHAEYAAQLVDTWKQSFPPWSQPWKLPIWLFDMHTGPMFAYPQGGRRPASVATFVLFVVGAVAAWKAYRSMFWLLLIPFGLNFAAASVRAYPYGDPERVAHYLAPAICWMAGLGLHYLFQRFIEVHHRSLARRIAVVVFGVFALATAVESVVKPYKDKNVVRSKAAVRTIAGLTQPGDQWVLFNADRPVPYAPYLGDWQGIGSVFVFDVLRFAPVPVAWSPAAEDVDVPENGVVWLLVYHVVHPKAHFPIELLDKYVATLSERMGPGKMQEFPVKEERKKKTRMEGTQKVEFEELKIEKIIAYRFEGLR